MVPQGVPVPGTAYRVDPVKAAFDIGCTIRWLDYNDTWLAAEWGHPSDNLGAILAGADFLCRQGKRITMRDVLTAMIQAHEIQGVLALENSFNRVGLDHVLLVRVASAAVAAHLLGGSTCITSGCSVTRSEGQQHSKLAISMRAARRRRISMAGRMGASFAPGWIGRCCSF